MRRLWAFDVDNKDERLSDYLFLSIVQNSAADRASILL